MEEGSLRADANVSVRRKGETKLDTKTELKNMNSFRFLMQGINAEVKRQVALREGGGRVHAGDAALRPGHGPAEPAALQGGGARLPLLPRARPRPGRADRGDARARRGTRCRSCRPSAPSATSATGSCRTTPRGCSRSSPTGATTSRRPPPPPRRSRRARSRNWVMELRGRLDGAEPIVRAVTAQAVAAARAARRGAQDHAGQRPQGARRSSSPRAATRRTIDRARGPRRDGGRRRAGRRSSPR